MGSSRFRGQAVALIAAYAVAMQALLSAFVPTVLPALASPFAVLCSHDAGDRTGGPVRHDLPCAAICAALGHGVAGPLPPAIVVAIATPQIVVALTPVNDWVSPHVAIRGPQSSRGPPLA